MSAWCTQISHFAARCIHILIYNLSVYINSDNFPRHNVWISYHKSQCNPFYISPKDYKTHIALDTQQKYGRYQDIQKNI